MKRKGVDLVYACMPIFVGAGEDILRLVYSLFRTWPHDLLAAFSALRVYAVYDRNKAIAVIVGLLSIAPAGPNLVRVVPINAMILSLNSENTCIDISLGSSPLNTSAVVSSVPYHRLHGVSTTRLLSVQHRI